MRKTTSETCQCAKCGGNCQGNVKRWNKCSKCENLRCTAPPPQAQQPQSKKSKASAASTPRQPKKRSKVQPESSNEQQQLSQPQVQPRAPAQPSATIAQVLLLSASPLLCMVCGALMCSKAALAAQVLPQPKFLQTDDEILEGRVEALSNAISKLPYTRCGDLSWNLVHSYSDLRDMCRLFCSTQTVLAGRGKC